LDNVPTEILWTTNEEQDIDNNLVDESEEEDWRIDLEGNNINDEVDIGEDNSDDEDGLEDNRRKCGKVAGV